MSKWQHRWRAPHSRFVIFSRHASAWRWKCVSSRSKARSHDEAVVQHCHSHRQFVLVIQAVQNLVRWDKDQVSIDMVGRFWTSVGVRRPIIKCFEQHKGAQSQFGGESGPALIIVIWGSLSQLKVSSYWMDLLFNSAHCYRKSYLVLVLTCQLQSSYHSSRWHSIVKYDWPNCKIDVIIA